MQMVVMMTLGGCLPCLFLQPRSVALALILILPQLIFLRQPLLLPLLAVRPFPSRKFLFPEWHLALWPTSAHAGTS
jgi:hypothetical protein